jgi:hypothetical protein
MEGQVLVTAMSMLFVGAVTFTPQESACFTVESQFSHVLVRFDLYGLTNLSGDTFWCVVGAGGAGGNRTGLQGEYLLQERCTAGLLGIQLFQGRPRVDMRCQPGATHG